MNTKPFPWKCGNCQKRAVVQATFPYEVELSHDGRKYAFVVSDLTAPRCTECGEVVLVDEASQRISEELRRVIGLLSPQEIRNQRDQIGKTQKELAAALGIAEATLSRWETGAQIQQRSMDRFMRLYFTYPMVREALADEANLQFPGIKAPDLLGPVSEFHAN